MTAFRAVALQFTGVPLELAANRSRLESHLRVAAAGGARLVVVPELATTGYTLSPELRDLSEEVPGPTTRWMSAMAAELDLTIVTSIAARVREGVSNLGVIVTPDGIAAGGAKRGLWGGEPALFARGAPGEWAVARTPVGRVGVAICYEAGFPEVARQLALAGAEIIAVPAAFGAARLHAWRLMTRSRALENGCFVVAANNAGTSTAPEPIAFCGHSTIVDPTGRTLQTIPEGEGQISALIDLALVGRARAAIPYLADLTHVTPSSGSSLRPAVRP